MNTIMVKARDNIELACHQFSPSGTATARLFLLHGGSFNHRRYANIGKNCATAGFETILVDWRGHGQSQGIAGTCDHVGQMEDDIADIILWFNHHQASNNQNSNNQLPTILGGHSAGAVICLRYIDRYGQNDIDGCYFIAPALSNTMEAMRYDHSSAKSSYLMNYFRPKPSHNLPPAAALKHIPQMNNRRFVCSLFTPFLPSSRHQKVLRFPCSEKMAQLEGRVVEYSFNLVMSISLPRYIDTFRSIQCPVLLVCGEQDEMLHPDFLPMVHRWHLSPLIDKSLQMLPKVNHMSVIAAASKILPQWLAQRWPESAPITESAPLIELETRPVQSQPVIGQQSRQLEQVL